jgi:C4-type Zn-finger protein
MSETKTPKHEKNVCHHSKKICYKDQKEAIVGLHKIQNAPTDGKKPVRAYKCDRCPYWHLTSKTIEEGTPGNYKIKLDWSKLLAA